MNLAGEAVLYAIAWAQLHGETIALAFTFFVGIASIPAIVAAGIYDTK